MVSRIIEKRERERETDRLPKGEARYNRGDPVSRGSPNRHANGAQPGSICPFIKNTRFPRVQRPRTVNASVCPGCYGSPSSLTGVGGQHAKLSGTRFRRVHPPPLRPPIYRPLSLARGNSRTPTHSYALARTHAHKERERDTHNLFPERRARSRPRENADNAHTPIFDSATPCECVTLAGLPAVYSRCAALAHSQKSTVFLHVRTSCVAAPGRAHAHTHTPRARFPPRMPSLNEHHRPPRVPATAIDPGASRNRQRKPWIKGGGTRRSRSTFCGILAFVP